MSYFKEDFVDSENENSLNADEMNMKQSNDQVGTIYKTMIIDQVWFTDFGTFTFVRYFTIAQTEIYLRTYLYYLVRLV